MTGGDDVAKPSDPPDDTWLRDAIKYRENMERQFPSLYDRLIMSYYSTAGPTHHK